MTLPVTSGLPSREEIEARISYESETGIFTWLRPGHNNMQSGSRAGQLTDGGYRSICINRKCILEHRLAWFLVHGYWPAAQIDHINRVRDDNRIANLREATPSQNSHNRERRNPPKCGERGLTQKNGRWVARIAFEGEEIYLGAHEDKEIMVLTRGLARDRAMRGIRPLSHADFADVREAMKRYAKREWVDPETGEIHETEEATA